MLECHGCRNLGGASSLESRITLNKTLYATALILSLFQKILTLDATYLVSPAPAATPTHLTATEVYALVPQLRVIAACESTGSPTGTPRQFNAFGTPLWGNNPITGMVEKKDVGELQIDYIHFPETKALGLDVINSADDNVYYGYLLFQQYGTSPWVASKNCWAQTVQNSTSSVNKSGEK